MPDAGIGEAIAAVSIADVATTAVVVGTTMSVVGAVTGDKTLTTVGGAIGLAGGITGLAGAAGLFNPSSTIGSLMADVAPSAAESGLIPQGAAGAAQESLGNAAVAASPGSAGEGDMGTMTGSETAPPLNPTTQPATQTPAPVGSGTLTPGQVAGTGEPALAQGTTIATEAPQSTPGKLDTSSLPAADQTTLTQANAATDKASAGSWLDKLSPDAKAHLAMAAGTLGGGVVQGIGSGLSASAKLAFEERVQAWRQGVTAQQMATATSTPGIINFPGQQKPTGVA